MVRALIIIAVALAGLAALGAHAAGSRLPLILLGALAGLIVLAAVGLALLRGATRHAVIVWAPPERVARDRMLPSPAPPSQAAIPPVRQDPFTSDGAAWAELIEQAEREELLRQGPREARVIAPRCEGPDCAEPLDGNPWKVRAETGDDHEEHSFCSRECAEEWQRQDAART